MPARSKGQQRLFGMALAVRRGEMKRSDVWDEVLDIVDSDMTDKEIEDFAKTKHDGLKEHRGMKSLFNYINEAVKELTLSTDPIKNDIYNYLKGFKIVWKVNTVDDALADITKEKYLARYLDDSDLKGAEKVYWMKCWNGGNTLTKSSPYNQAEIVSYKNNTDTKWFFVVNGKSVTVIRYTNRYYGMGEIKEVINKFEI